MAVKLRLQRHGRKAKPFYHIVASDARSKRDGRIIERIGSYNPNTNPATIELNIDSALVWLQNGAEPTNTVRAILSNQGVLYKKHLLRGVKLGVINEADVQEKFNLWLEEKSKQIESKKTKLKEASNASSAEAFEREQKIRINREEALAAKNTPPAEEADNEEVNQDNAVTEIEGQENKEEATENTSTPENAKTDEIAENKEVEQENEANETGDQVKAEEEVTETEKATKVEANEAPAGEGSAKTDSEESSKKDDQKTEA